MRVVRFFLVFAFCVQVFGYDIQILEEHLKSIEKNQNPEELYTVLSETLEEVVRQAPSYRCLASAEAVNDFIDAKYIPDTFFNPGALHDFVGYSWTVYPKFLRAYAQLNGLVEIDQKYAAQLFQQGVISSDRITSFMTTLNQAKIIPILASQTNAKYHNHYEFDSQEEYYNKINKYLLLEDVQLKALKSILEELKLPIASCIGSPWRVVNVRCWKSHPRELQYDVEGGWHTDGFPYDAKKIMLYPKGCSHEIGTTQFISGYDVEGPPGTWLLFENTKIWHRAICPQLSEKAQDRLIVEITIAPAYKFELEPICAGHLALWPLTPW